MVCIIGTGYLGTITAIGLAELGYDVVGYDVDAARIADLCRGVAPYTEAHVEDLIRKHAARGRIRFTADHADAVRGAELILVSVATPLLADGTSDLRDLWAAVDALAKADLQACEVVVLRSTLPPGTSAEVAAALAPHVPVAYAPEFLREGTAITDFLSPDRTVVGCDDLDAAVVYARLFESLGAPVMLTTWQNAELIKAASNAYLAMKISFANEIANLCGATGADADEVLRGVGYDRRIGSAFLRPGIGFGGPFLDRDLSSLRRTAELHGVPLHLAAATSAANAEQTKRIGTIVAEELGGVSGSTIAVWGLAYKAGTNDVRESVAVRIVADLLAAGAAVNVFDPAVNAAGVPPGATAAPSALAAAAGADAVLVLTDWPEFAQIPPAAIARALAGSSVIDARNLLDGERISSAGLRYRSLGRHVEAERAALPVAI